jgi:hypothetical protein
VFAAVEKKAAAFLPPPTMRRPQAQNTMQWCAIS